MLGPRSSLCGCGRRTSLRSLVIIIKALTTRCSQVAYDNSPRQTRANTLARVMQHYGALDHYVPSTEQLI